MDWLIPDKHAARRIRIPCLVQDYETLEFHNTADVANYPTRNGLSKEHYRDSRNLDHTYGGRFTREQAAGLLQAWLFFGTMCWMTSLPIRVRDYVKKSPADGDGCTEITLTQLDALLPAWQRRLKAVSQEEVDREGEVLDRYLAHLHSTFQTVLSVRESDQPQARTPLPEEARLGLIVLLKILVSTKCLFYSRATFKPNEWIYDTENLLRLKLERNGWCEHERVRLFRNLSSVGLVYLAGLEPRQIARNHTFCDPDASERPKYEPKHVCQDRACEMLGVKPSALIEIVENEEVPLLTFGVDSNGKNECRLRQKMPGMLYVAISHVCSEGLGNMDENMLPSCRLKKLQTDVNALYAVDRRTVVHASSSTAQQESDDVPFWIDTLCVPLSKFNSSARDLAIASMAEIYRDADKVLVLDAELMTLPNDRINAVEKRLIMSNCIWWTRLWTLQEGLLAKRLYFLVNQEAIEVHQGGPIWRFFVEKARTMWEVAFDPNFLKMRLLALEAFKGFAGLWECRMAPVQQKSAYLWAGLAPRATSTADDEPLCLATLFEVDVATLVQYPVSERMPTLLSMHKTFPSRSIFWSAFLDTETEPGQQTSNWYERVGLRWSPQSFVKLGGFMTGRDHYQPNDPGEPQGVATPMGLRVRYPGFLFEVDMASGNREKLWIRQVGSPRTYAVHIVTGLRRYGLHLRASSPSLQVGVILPRLPSKEGYGDRVVISVLVIVQGQSEMPEHVNEKVIYCSPCCRTITVWWKDEEVDGTDPPRDPPDIPALWLDQDIEWCVG